MTKAGPAWLKHLPCVIVLLCMAVAPCWAKSTGVATDSALESGPCFKALVDRNAERPTTAPDRELGSACDVENGNVDKAWERVQRLWGESSGMPDYGDFAPPEAQGLTPWGKTTAVLSMVLVYIVLGTPVRSAAQLMGVDRGSMAFVAVRLLGSLFLRVVIALSLRSLLQIPYATLLGSVLVVGLVLRGRPLIPMSATSVEIRGDTTSPSAFCVYAADILNDGLGSTLGLLAITILAERDAVLLAVALVLAMVMSVPRILVERRRLRANPRVFTAVSALLTAVIGAFALLDPPVAAAVGSGKLVATALFLLLLCLALALGRRHLGSPRRQLVG